MIGGKGINLAWLFVSALVLIIGVSGCVSTSGSEEHNTRRALLIGMSGYSGAAVLKNPANDASDLEAALSSLGFYTKLMLDVNHLELSESINIFFAELEPGDEVVLYYAGHGIQVDGKNFLIPLDMLAGQYDIGLAYPLENLLERMKLSGSGVNIVILDACRNNPFAGELASSGTVSSARDVRGLIRRQPVSKRDGLAEIKNAPKNTYIAYATGINQVALDGDGRNGVFTQSILANILQKDGVSIETLMRKVRGDVMINSRRIYASMVEKESLSEGSLAGTVEQTPWSLSSLTSEFIFKKIDKSLSRMPPP